MRGELANVKNGVSKSNTSSLKGHESKDVIGNDILLL